MEKAELLDAFFTSVFVSMASLQECQVPDIRGKGWTREVVPLMEDHQVREYLSKLNIGKSNEPDAMPPWVLKATFLQMGEWHAHDIARPLSAVFDQ